MSESLEEIVAKQKAQISELKDEVSELKDDIKDLEDEVYEAGKDAAAEAENEIYKLEDKLEQTINPKTLEDEMKLKMLVRISEQCNLTQIEVLHQFAIDYFPTFNPHI